MPLKCDFPAFRVWIDKYGCMFKVKTLFDSGCFTLYAPQNNGEEWPGTECIFDGLHLMQGTGYEDNNGKEVFEDDVVHICDGQFRNGVYERQEYILIKMDAKTLERLENAEELEVVGNIHEIPELLKEVSKR